MSCLEILIRGLFKLYLRQTIFRNVYFSNGFTNLSSKNCMCIELFSISRVPLAWRLCSVTNYEQRLPDRNMGFTDFQKVEETCQDTASHNLTLAFPPALWMSLLLYYPSESTYIFSLKTFRVAWNFSFSPASYTVRESFGSIIPAYLQWLHSPITYCSITYYSPIMYCRSSQPSSLFSMRVLIPFKDFIFTFNYKMVSLCFWPSSINALFIVFSYTVWSAGYLIRT